VSSYPFSEFFTLLPWRKQEDQSVEPRPSDADLEAASLAISFSHHPGYVDLMEWLEKEADRPVQPRSETHEMISGITRQNTMKEVRDYLRRKTNQAQETMTRHRESENG
jgi:hypothetical protein